MDRLQDLSSHQIGGVLQDCWYMPCIRREVFRAIIRSKESERLQKSGSISFTCVREIILAKLGSLGYSPELYGTHSFRAKGAMLAARQGVLDRMFKRHGWWASETAKDVHVKDSLKARLEVSKSLEL